MPLPRAYAYQLLIGACNLHSDVMNDLCLQGELKQELLSLKSTMDAEITELEERMRRRIEIREQRTLLQVRSISVHCWLGLAALQS